MAEPPVKSRARFQFELRHLIWVTILLAASLGLFGIWGILVAVYILSFWWSVFSGRKKAELKAAKAKADEEPPMSRSDSSDRSAFTLAELLAVFAIIVLLLGLLMLYLPAYTFRDGCFYNLARLKTGLWEYSQKHGTMPPVYVADDAGKPAHSWRVLILPELGHQDLYDQYRFDEPWDSPHNRKLLDETPREYQCHDRALPFGEHQPPEPGMTTYLAVTGKGAVWPDATPETLEELADSEDGAALVIDAEFQPVPWTKPEDFSLEDISCLVDSPDRVEDGHWQRGFLWSTYCGRRAIWTRGNSLRFTPPCEVAQLKELLTVGNSTPGKEAEYLEARRPLAWRRPHYTNIARLVIFLVAAAWPIVWIVKERRSAKVSRPRRNG